MLTAHPVATVVTVLEEISDTARGIPIRKSHLVSQCQGGVFFEMAIIPDDTEAFLRKGSPEVALLGTKATTASNCRADRAR